jgi:hypothetical protein
MYRECAAIIIWKNIKNSQYDNISGIKSLIQTKFQKGEKLHKHDK